jgi:hypothetical protein
MKNFLTSPNDRYRPSYGRFSQEFPRQNVFICTINPEAGGYFADRTGNRRFWPVTVTKIDVEGLVKARDQIWAEAIERNILCNVVDDLSRGDTYFAALHTQGPVRVAVTTSGTAPALAQVLRDRIAHALPSNLAEVAAILEGERLAAQAEHGTSEGINWRPRIEELLAGLGGGDSNRCDDGRSDRGSVAS